MNTYINLVMILLTALALCSMAHWVKNVIDFVTFAEEPCMPPKDWPQMCFNFESFDIDTSR